LRQARIEKSDQRLRHQPTQSVPIRTLNTDQNATVAIVDGSGLAEVIDAWPTLPEPIRAGILAMIRSAAGKR